MAEQLPFSLPTHTSYELQDFFVGPCNQTAFQLATDEVPWPLGKCLITGPNGSGKSHLAQIWAKATHAEVLTPKRPLPHRSDATCVVVDDAHLVAEDADQQTALFHLHNNLAAAGGRLLLTSSNAPSLWGVELPDLLSRMSGTLTAQIGDPEEDTLHAVLLKQLMDRQLRPGPGVLETLLRYMDRSFATAQAVVAEIDTLSLAHGRNITAPLAREALDRLLRKADAGTS